MSGKLHMQRSENGRVDCDYCPDSTKGQPVILIHNPQATLGKQVPLRAHLKCYAKQPSKDIAIFLGETS